MSNFSSNQRRSIDWKGLAIVGQQPWLHRCLLILWMLVPLLWGFFDLEQQRLIAHDEGLYATRARTMLREQDWIHPWERVHHKTPGSYWILASMFRLFGVSEVTARFPSVIAGVVCGLLVYELAKDLLNSRVALWSVLTLSTSFLWVQYGRFATPDMVFIALFLGGLLCLLKAEGNGPWGQRLRFVAGLCWGLAFLVRSFLVLLPIAALMPYLLLENRRHCHLASPWFYGGLGLGLLPTLLWLVACWQRLGNDIFQSLLGFPVRKAAGGDDPIYAGSLFYFTSIELNSLPWGLFVLGGIGALFTSRPTRRQVLLLGGYPLIVFGLLSLSSTHLHHYALVLYPFLAMLTGSAIAQILASKVRWVGRSAIALAIFLSALGGVLTVLSGALLVLSPAQFSFVAVARPYVPIALPLGILWLASGLVWLGSGRCDRWLVGLLLANWITLIGAGHAGILSNGDPALKTFLLQPDVSAVLAQNPVNFAPLEGKLSVLIRFYTPTHGLRLDSAAVLPDSGYAWVWASDLGEIPAAYTVIGQFNEAVLIRLGG